MSGDRKVLVATTMAAFYADDPDTWGSWLKNAEAMREVGGAELDFFAALELDLRGIEPFGPLVDRLAEVGGSYWTFHLDDGRERVTTDNRLRHITMGQNLATDKASEPGYTHMLFMASDTEPPADAVPKLLEVMDMAPRAYRLVGGNVPTYCFDGPDLAGPLEYHDLHVFAHMPTAAFVMIERSLYKPMKWRWDIDEGMSDDPAYAYDAEHLHQVVGLIRRDVVGRHHPEAIGPVESRGHNMRVYR